MSRTARSVPRTVPVTFERPRRGRWLTGHLADLPAGLRRPDHHLERPAEPPVAQPERQQRLAAGGAHRPEVGQPHAAAPPQLERQRAVREPAVERAGAAAGAEHEVGVAGRDRLGDPGEVTRVEGGVAVHEADDVGARRRQAGEAGGAEARPRLEHHPGAERGGQRARPVGRPVVDHDRLVAGGHALEHPGEGLALVEDGKDDRVHGWDTYPCYAAGAITDQ